MLIDLDLDMVDSKRTSGRHITSIIEFTTINVLCNFEHVYCHDIEMLFYVLLGMCIGCAWEKGFYCSVRDRTRCSYLDEWPVGNAADVANVKRENMHIHDILRNSSRHSIIPSRCARSCEAFYSSSQSTKAGSHNL